MYGWLRFVYSKGLEVVILMLIFIDDDDDEDEDDGEDSDSCSIIWIINLVLKKKIFKYFIVRLYWSIDDILYGYEFLVVMCLKLMLFNLLLLMLFLYNLILLFLFDWFCLCYIFNVWYILWMDVVS